MKYLIFLKAAVSLIALIAVLKLMGAINAESVSKAFQALGIEPGTQSSPGLQPSNRLLKEGEARYNLCKTRVHAIIFPDGRKVEEHKNGLDLKWMAVDNQATEISYLGVEKWFSQHCQIIITPREIKHGETLEFGDYATIEFIDGSKTTVLRALDGTLKIGDDIFLSEDFEEALEELKVIAGWTKFEEV